MPSCMERVILRGGELTMRWCGTLRCISIIVLQNSTRKNKNKKLQPGKYWIFFRILRFSEKYLCYKSSYTSLKTRNKIRGIQRNKMNKIQIKSHRWFSFLLSAVKVKWIHWMHALVSNIHCFCFFTIDLFQLHWLFGQQFEVKQGMSYN